MYITTRAIVFRQIRYSDTSLVVRLLTERSGLMSCLIKGAHGPKSKIKASLFQPLNLIEIVLRYKEKSDLQHLREARVEYAYQSIPSDIRKTSVLLFLNELLYKSIREEAANPGLFDYIHNHLVFLDMEPEISGAFHLLFTLHLTRFLGFFPQRLTDHPDMVFNLQEGQFTKSGEMLPGQVISGRECEAFIRLLSAGPQDHKSVSIPAHVRHSLLEKMLLFYCLHLPITGEFKSHQVLHEVLQK